MELLVMATNKCRALAKGALNGIFDINKIDLYIIGMVGTKLEKVSRMASSPVRAPEICEPRAPLRRARRAIYNVHLRHFANIRSTYLHAIARSPWLIPYRPR